MTRLIERAQTPDPELMVGLVSACRYCGLLDASVAAHKRAVELDPRIRTSVPHTWFLQADHTRLATVKVEEFPYIVPLALAEAPSRRRIAACTAGTGTKDQDPHPRFHRRGARVA